jgi:hypothetical protein
MRRSRGGRLAGEFARVTRGRILPLVNDAAVNRARGLAWNWLWYVPLWLLLEIVFFLSSIRYGLEGYPPN